MRNGNAKRGPELGAARSAMVAGVVVVAASLLALPDGARACGDRLAALGGGMRFERIFYSRHPGRVLVYAPAATRLHAASERLGVVAALKHAGHEVAAVEDRDGLERAIGGTAPDVILVDAGVGDEALPPAGSSTIVPVAFTDARGAQGQGPALRAAGGGCVVEVGGRSVRELLRAVEGVLERRRRGDAAACGASSARRGTN